MSNRIDLTLYEKHHLNEEYGEYFCDLCSCRRSGDEGYPPSLRRVVVSACSCDRDIVGAIEVQPLIAELKRCYEELDRAQCFIQQRWVKFESYTDDGKDLFVDMEDDDGNRFSGWIDRAQASE